MRFQLKSQREFRHRFLSRAARHTVELLERRQLLSLSFGPAQVIGATGDITFPTNCALADFDLDGHLDVAGFGADRVAWYRNNGSGGFQGVQTITTDVGTSAVNSVAADVNKDGRPDLVVPYYEYPVADSYAKSRVAWYEYRPQTGRWREHIITDGSIGGLNAVAAGDLDRDGDTDVVATNYRFEESIKVVWFENKGNGLTWSAHTICDDESIGTGSQSVTLLDANADGWLDAAVGARFSATLTLYRNPASRQNVVKLWNAVVMEDDRPEMAGMASGDLDGDGYVDVIALTGNPYDPIGDPSPRVAWYRNNPAQPGQFGPAISLAKAGEYQRPYFAQPADFDRDGDLDLLVGCVGHVDWFENLGSGVFSKVMNIGADADADAEAGDIDGDGWLDVVTANAPGDHLAWYRSMGATKNGVISGVVFKDRDQDGKRDTGEAGIKGRTVFLDLDNDKKKDAGEPSAVTDSKGKYSISKLAAGDYNVRQVLPSNWAQSTPKNGNGYKVQLKAGQAYTGVLHGSYWTLGSISGRVFNDLDLDGRFDSNESPLKGRKLFADLDNDKKLDANEPSAVTNSNGWYTIKNLRTGDYNIRQILPAGWIQTTPKNEHGIKVHLLSGHDRSGFVHGASLMTGRLLGPFVKGSGYYTRVPNGGFESGLKDWYEINTDRGVFSTVTSPSLVGTRCAAASPFQFVGPAGFAIGQTIKVTPGATYILSGWVNTSADGGGSAYLDLGDAVFEPGEGPAGILASMGQSKTQFIYAAFTVPSDVSSIEVRVVRDGYAGPVKPGVLTWFDDIAVTPAAQFKTPTVA